MSEVSFILISAFCLSVPLGVKYLIAFQTRHLLDDLKGREREIECLVAQAEALESQRMVMRRAVDQVGSQCRQGIEQLWSNLVLSPVATRGGHQRGADTLTLTQQSEQPIVFVIGVRGCHHERARVVDLS